MASSLPEYPVVRAMDGVGAMLAPRLIAKIGDVHRFHSGKALVAFAGIDAPPYQSGHSSAAIGIFPNEALLFYVRQDSKL